MSTNSGLLSSTSSDSAVVIVSAVSGTISSVSGTESSTIGISSRRAGSTVISSLYTVSAPEEAMSATVSLGTALLTGLVYSPAVFSETDTLFAAILSETCVTGLAYCILLLDICLAMSVMV